MLNVKDLSAKVHNRYDLQLVDAQGNIKYLAGSYKTALAAAMAENKTIEKGKLVKTDKNIISNHYSSDFCISAIDITRACIMRQ